jgi:hypothetical protein
MPDPVGLRLDDEDMALLEACVRAEKLSKSDILRRALRAYAKTLGVDMKPTGQAKPKARKK